MPSRLFCVLVFLQQEHTHTHKKEPKKIIIHIVHNLHPLFVKYNELQRRKKTETLCRQLENICYGVLADCILERIRTHI